MLPSIVGLYVLFEVSRWIPDIFRSLSLWTIPVTAVFVSTATTIWITAKGAPQKTGVFASAICGILISVVGTLAFYVDLIMSAQAAFYGIREASRHLQLARFGLAMCIVTFIFSIVTIVRTACAKQ